MQQAELLIFISSYEFAVQMHNEAAVGFTRSEHF